MFEVGTFLGRVFLSWVECWFRVTFFSVENSSETGTTFVKKALNSIPFLMRRGNSHNYLSTLHLQPVFNCTLETTSRAFRHVSVLSLHWTTFNFVFFLVYFKYILMNDLKYQKETILWSSFLFFPPSFLSFVSLLCTNTTVWNLLVTSQLQGRMT